MRSAMETAAAEIIGESTRHSLGEVSIPERSKRAAADESGDRRLAAASRRRIEVLTA
jgi:hypothetical protein